MRNEVRFAGREQHNLQLAMLRLNESGPVDVNLAPCRIGVLDGERAAAADLKAVMKDGSGIEPVVAEAGAGIVDFKKLYRSAGAVFDRGIDVIGAASGDAKAGYQHRKSER